MQNQQGYTITEMAKLEGVHQRTLSEWVITHGITGDIETKRYPRFSQAKFEEIKRLRAQSNHVGAWVKKKSAGKTQAEQSKGGIEMKDKDDAQSRDQSPNGDDTPQLAYEELNKMANLVKDIHYYKRNDDVRRLKTSLKAVLRIDTTAAVLSTLAESKDYFQEFYKFLAQHTFDYYDKDGEQQKLVRHNDGTFGFEPLDYDPADDTTVAYVLTIDSEFKDLIPPLDEDSRAQLEANILRDGIRDPIVIWKGHNIIVDGHNRYEIAQAHNLKDYTTKEMEFADRDAVKVWIIQNQFGRRNMSPYDRSILALKLKPIIAAQAKAKQAEYHGNQYESGLSQKSAEVQKPIDTRAEVAKLAGVSHDTIAKAEKLQEMATPEILSALHTGELKINAAYAAVKAGATTVEAVQSFKAQKKKSAPKPKAVEDSQEPTTEQHVNEVDGNRNSTPAEVPTEKLSTIVDGNANATVPADDSSVDTEKQSEEVFEPADSTREENQSPADGNADKPATVHSSATDTEGQREDNSLPAQDARVDSVPAQIHDMRNGALKMAQDISSLTADVSDSALPTAIEILQVALDQLRALEKKSPANGQKG